MSSVAVVHAVALGALAVGVNLVRAFEEPRAERANAAPNSQFPANAPRLSLRA